MLWCFVEWWCDCVFCLLTTIRRERCRGFRGRRFLWSRVSRPRTSCWPRQAIHLIIPLCPIIFNKHVLLMLSCMKCFQVVCATKTLSKYYLRFMPWLGPSYIKVFSIREIPDWEKPMFYSKILFVKIFGWSCVLPKMLLND